MTVRELVAESEIALQTALERLRAVRRETWLKIGACVAVAALFTVGLALRGDPTVHKRVVRAAHARAAILDAAHSARQPAAIDPAAARKGDPRALNRLVAMTRADTCGARTEAAKALAGVRNPKAVAALRKLARSSFQDESDSPGIFSCSSRRAARKALEAHKS